MADFDKSLYKVKRLFPDEGFENGFNVLPVKDVPNRMIPVGKFQYPESGAEPSWMIAPWYSNACLIEDRKDVGDPYILTDKEDTKLVKYNPKEKSVTLQMNAQNIYKGKTTVPKFWPHLLIEQRDIVDYKNMPEGDEKKFYSANADKICVEFDMRINEYVPTTNPEGYNSCQFVAFLYLNLVDANWIYLGVSPFVDNWIITHYFKKETGGNNHIYALSTETIFGSVENSFNTPDGKAVVGEWKHIEVDLTPHIDSIMEAANNELIFGRPVSRDEFYFSGTNMGFEVHGNISCAVEIKNYNIVSYIKKEEA